MGVGGCDERLAARLPRRSGASREGLKATGLDGRRKSSRLAPLLQRSQPRRVSSRWERRKPRGVEGDGRL